MDSNNIQEGSVSPDNETINVSHDDHVVINLHESQSETSRNELSLAEGIHDYDEENGEFTHNANSFSNISSKTSSETKLNQEMWLSNYLNYIQKDQVTERTIRLNINNISYFSKKVFTPFAKICNIPWRLTAKTECSKRTNEKKFFSAYIECNPDSESCLWSCSANVTLRILSTNPNDPHIVKSFYNNFNYTSNNWGFPGLVEWDKLIDSNKGYTTGDKLVLEATISVKNITGIKQVKTYDFTQTQNLTSDTFMNVDGINIKVNKDYLSLYSPVFKAMFYSNFAESTMETITIKDVNIDQFIELLEVIYPSHKPISTVNVEFLLELSDRFEISYVLNQCEKFLIKTNEIPIISKLAWSDAYCLSNLQDACMSNFKKVSDLKNLKDTKEYTNLSNSTKAALLEKMLKLL
ncbi:BTB/POZ-like domain and MATH domain and TRAF-like domain and BTB/POZ fold domain and BTB/POZ domain-containing protein [Strongyloides ratti]|uniref:BTB/POZ-like domain and MATH domain and TRAF-like domain and BTB/POZ fold domain and BTB/POZ domain-containing protein n=1 Tax=Strongyloides ratti TaxID=34506 RepID=A0A090MY27_STRRB|nr:BTB/POZ-like domain and MATH domain and TRAF-like domain and BTB/POZ fold domain and BTB/POZ domain-containing protein [Strongyloides ratti]CEF66454.1 BTB/POZ-like domain and MATH domain and TRAF-like domain and BTB/POZ fold domain and BTB/POZ domain-containing protein [Strongyloides ratti]